MARSRSSKPWSMIVATAILFLIAWWIEDCLIYYVSWSQLRIVQFGARLLTLARFPLVITTVSAALSAFATSTGNLFGALGALIGKWFNALPADIRASRPLRFLAWCGFTLSGTFGGKSLAIFGNGVLWTAGKLLKALIALNGGFWLHNLGRRFAHSFDAIVMYPVRFYGERSLVEQGDLPETSVEEGEPIEEIGRKRDSRTRRREYVQFFQGHVERIGIILSGGGARGAYQAGALKAIHEFLGEYRALHKVKMIAGTSIGAWNAMFWLAGLMDTDNPFGRPSIESWWKSFRFNRMVDFPWLYIPFLSGSLLRPRPWRDSFVDLFGKRLQRALDPEHPINFYLTRSDVEAGVLKYATNRADIENRIDTLGRDKDDGYRFFDVIAPGSDALQRTADAVFASMDLSPVFPHPRLDDGTFENGGVIDSLPFRFGSPVEDCDLIFVLPLNAMSEENGVVRGGLLRRVSRVAELRQGALERAALNTADTINRFAQRVERLDFGINTMISSSPPQGVAAEALGGVQEELAEFSSDYKLLYVFTACPSGKLELGTFDFWKHKSIRDAFDLMYLQTKRELQNRLFEDIEPEDPHMVLIDAAVPEIDSLPKPRYRRLCDL